MTKNWIIGLLVAVVVIGGAYWLIQSSQNSNPAYTTPTTTTTPNTTVNNYTTPPATSPTTTPPLTISTPTVETNSSVTTSTSSALVTGQVTPGGVPTTYWFEYGATNSLGSVTVAQQIGSGFYPISSPAFITGLSSDTNYYFRLVANNSMGTVYGATYSFTTNESQAPVASLPVANTNSANSIARTSANLNGQVNPRGWATNYWFEYGQDRNLGNVTTIASLAASTSSSNISQSVSGLNPLTRYYFRLDAQNQFGTVTGSIFSFTTPGPQNPGAPVITTSQATNLQTDAARLNGRINPNGADTTYWFEYSEDSLLGTLINSGTPMQTISAGTNTVNVQADITGLNSGTRYYYHLVGKNQYGTIYGSILSFTTRPS